jgi:hypothetical protein
VDIHRERDVPHALLRLAVDPAIGCAAVLAAACLQPGLPVLALRLQGAADVLSLVFTLFAIVEQLAPYVRIELVDEFCRVLRVIVQVARQVGKRAELSRDRPQFRELLNRRVAVGNLPVRLFVRPLRWQPEQVRLLVDIPRGLRHALVDEVELFGVVGLDLAVLQRRYRQHVMELTLARRIDRSCARAARHRVGEHVALAAAVRTELVGLATLAIELRLADFLDVFLLPP